MTLARRSPKAAALSSKVRPAAGIEPLDGTPRRSPAVVKAGVDRDAILWLNDYLPYRMAVVAARMLREAARVYKKRRDPLTTPQWRIMGILANFEPLTASEISRISMLDKVAISRALVEMVRRRFVVRRRTRRDRRELEVTLTSEGWRFYRALVPELLGQEQYLRSVLEPGEIEMLFGIFERLEVVFADLDARRRRYGDDEEIRPVRRLRAAG